MGSGGAHTLADIVLNGEAANLVDTGLLLNVGDVLEGDVLGEVFSDKRCHCEGRSDSLWAVGELVGL